MTHKPNIGLIGGMGSGKSTVAREFLRHGGIILSGDQFGHEALLDPKIKAAIVERWGKELLNDKGEIERRKLGSIVFANPDERAALEAWSFPFIERRFREESAKAQDNPGVRFIVLDAAIMLEAGWNKVCDWLVYVHSPREVRLARLAKQRGWNAKEVQAREGAQWPLTDKATLADAVIDNSGSADETARQVETLLRQWIQMSHKDG